MKHSLLGIISAIVVLIATLSSVMISNIFRVAAYRLDMMMDIMPFLYNIPNVFFFCALVIGVIALFQKNTKRTWAIVGVSISAYVMFRLLTFHMSRFIMDMVY